MCILRATPGMNDITGEDAPSIGHVKPDIAVAHSRFGDHADRS